MKKGMWIEGITLCYFCDRPSLHRENFSIVHPSFVVEKAGLSNALRSAFHSSIVSDRDHTKSDRENPV